MNSRVSSGLTACVAVATAGVIALTPMATSTPTPPRVIDAQISLTGVSDFVGKSPDALLIIAEERLAQQPQQVPFIPVIAALAIAAGDEDRLYTVARSIIDAPLYVADPVIYAAAATLPESLGGNPDDPAQSEIWTQFRDGQLYGLRQDLHAPVAEALGVNPNLDANYAFYLSNKLMESALNTASLAVLSPAGLIPLAQAVVSGDKTKTYLALQSYIDAPLWAADPAIEGIAEALPAALGGGTNHDPRTSEGNGTTINDDGAFMQFRNKQLIGARNTVRVAVANALDVDVDSTGNVTEPSTSTANRSGVQPSTADVPGAGSNSGSDVANLKPHFTNPGTNLNTALGNAKDRAEKRADKAKVNAQAVAKKMRDAAGKAVRHLKPKGSED